jgi:23S rRNA (pseudouridine1915-N3)-methyltransferase
VALELWWTGKNRNDAVESLVGDYIQRITKYTSIKTRVFKDSKQLLGQKRKEEETAQVLKALAPGDHCVLLDENGTLLSTLDLTRKLGESWLRKKRCVLVIGGSHGVTQALKDRANETIALSKMVLPHQFARLIISEQLYRAFTIRNNENYHH